MSIKQSLATGERIASKRLYLSQLLYIRRKVDILDHHKLGFVAVSGKVIKEEGL
jgi:hypothetical protein